MRETGIVKWFNDKNGYGFILDSNQGDVFVHYSAIIPEEENGYRTLKPNQKVEYIRTDGKKPNTFAALKVRLVSE